MAHCVPRDNSRHFSLQILPVRLLLQQVKDFVARDGAREGISPVLVPDAPTRGSSLEASSTFLSLSSRPRQENGSQSLSFGETALHKVRDTHVVARATVQRQLQESNGKKRTTLSPRSHFLDSSYAP